METNIHIILILNFREYAVSVLIKFVEKNYAQLEFLILQLVSCLRYEGPNFKESVLLKFLFDNITKSPKLAANFFWNIRIESESQIKSVQKLYENIGTYFWTHLASSTEHEYIRELLAYQLSLRDTLSMAFDVLVHNNGKGKEVKKEKLRKFLQEKKKDVESLFEGENFFVFKGKVCGDNNCYYLVYYSVFLLI